MTIDRPLHLAAPDLAIADARAAVAGRAERGRPSHRSGHRPVLAALPPLPEAAGAIESATLLRGAPRIAIRHGGDLYWLQATRQGKLLLTK